MSKAKAAAHDRRFEEAKIFMQMWVPLMLSEYFVHLEDQLTFVLFGHYDTRTEHYAGLAYGRSYLLVTAGAIGTGVSMGIPVLVSQNHGRGADNENGWVLWQTTKGLLVAFAIAVAAACVFRPASLAIGQPAGAVAIGQVYVGLQMFGMFAYFWNGAVETVLACAGFVGATAGLRTFGSAFNLVLTFFFLSCGWGYIGLCFADCISFWLHTLLLVVFIARTGKWDAVFGLAVSSADDTGGAGQPWATPLSLRSYLWMTLPLAIGGWVEALAGELLTVLAGWTRGADASIAAQSVINSVAGLYFFAFGQAGLCLMMRVGHLLGSQDFARIPIAIKTTMELVVLVGGLCAVSVAVQQENPRLMWLFTNNPEIIAEAVTATLGIALAIPLFATMDILSCSLRIAGQAVTASCTGVVCMLLVGAPLMYLFGVWGNLGLLGTWFGNLVAMTVATVSMGWRLCNLDWVGAAMGAMEEEQASKK